MRRHDDAWVAPERMIRRQRLGRKYIQHGSAQLPLVEGRKEVRFDHMTAARDVHDACATWKGCKCACIQNSGRLWGEREEVQQDLSLSKKRLPAAVTFEYRHAVQLMRRATPT